MEVKRNHAQPCLLTKKREPIRAKSSRQQVVKRPSSSRTIRHSSQVPTWRHPTFLKPCLIIQTIGTLMSWRENWPNLSKIKRIMMIMKSLLTMMTSAQLMRPWSEKRTMTSIYEACGAAANMLARTWRPHRLTILTECLTSKVQKLKKVFFKSYPKSKNNRVTIF